MNEPGTIYPSTWGFVPEWGLSITKSLRNRYNTLNARSETLLSSKMYRESTRDQRCVIIADGFFESTLRKNQLSFSFKTGTLSSI